MLVFSRTVEIEARELIDWVNRELEEFQNAKSRAATKTAATKKTGQAVGRLA
jgi:hypothetical protein